MCTADFSLPTAPRKTGWLSKSLLKLETCCKDICVLCFELPGIVVSPSRWDPAHVEGELSKGNFCPCPPQIFTFEAQGCPCSPCRKDEVDPGWGKEGPCACVVFPGDKAQLMDFSNKILSLGKEPAPGWSRLWGCNYMSNLFESFCSAFAILCNPSSSGSPVGCPWHTVLAARHRVLPRAEKSERKLETPWLLHEAGRTQPAALGRGAREHMEN